MNMNIMNVDYSTKIPNNVNLAEDRQVLKALEGWHPGYMDWWSDMGPEGFQESLVYLRTAYSVDPRGWAKFDYVRMPDYRWGILLAPQEENRVVPFGEHYGEPAWQEVPGEHRAMLRRLIVIQGDTEPASVEQQRHLGKTAPSLYDMRNLFQVNVEEGRHLWAMVYLLQKYLRRACSALSTRRRRTGCPSSCSPTSPTVTARCSCTASRSPASIRSRAPAASCSRKKRTTCSSARPASPVSCSAPAMRCAKPASPIPPTSPRSARSV
jgi:hypothetical protein